MFRIKLLPVASGVFLGCGGEGFSKINLFIGVDSPYSAVLVSTVQQSESAMRVQTLLHLDVPPSQLTAEH